MHHHQNINTAACHLQICPQTSSWKGIRQSKWAAVISPTNTSNFANYELLRYFSMRNGRCGHDMLCRLISFSRDLLKPDWSLQSTLLLIKTILVYLQVLSRRRWASTSICALLLVRCCVRLLSHWCKPNRNRLLDRVAPRAYDKGSWN